jgi:hypothetical protein
MQQQGNWQHQEYPKQIFIKEQQQEKEHHQHQKTPATAGIQHHSRDPKTNTKVTSRMQASTGKA